MKKMIVLALCLLGFQLSAAETKKEEKTEKVPSVRVLLQESAPSVLLEARGPYVVINKENGKELSFGTSGKRYAAYMLTEGVRWGEEFVDTYAIQVTMTDPNHYIYVDGMQYKGNVSLYGREDGTLCVINEVPLEEFVTATLASQISTALTKEAMAAMAISARTLAYKAMCDNQKELWDLSANDVGYFGHGLTMKKNGAEEAVNSTLHIVMLGESKVPMHIPLTKEVALQLANKGLNAKEILKSYGVKELGNTKTIETIR